jgi:hypothetical protein
MGSADKRRSKRLVFGLAGGVAVAAAAGYAAVYGVPGLWHSDSQDAELAATTFHRYCLDCHDDATASGDMVIDPR